MKRPVGIITVSILQSIVGLGWLSVFAFASTFVLHLSTHPFEDMDDPLVIAAVVGSVLLEGFVFIALAGLFLAGGYGLWRRRRWARALTVALATLSVVAFLVSFFANATPYPPSDRIDTFDMYDILTMRALSLPYDLAVWPIWKGAMLVFPDLPFYLRFIARFSIGIVANALIVRYMLSAPVKQAFGAAS